MRKIFLGSLLVIFLSALCSAEATTAAVISQANLPGSIGQVISDLEKDQGCSEVVTACLVTSRSVTRQQKNAVLTSLVGSDERAKVAGASSGLVVAQPDSTQEVAAAATACGGTIIYLADAVDLSRGEGLFDNLAPAIEALLASGKGAALVVVAPPGLDKDSTKKLLEKEAESILSTLVSDSSVAILNDIFDRVVYVSSAEEAIAAVAASKVSVVDASERARTAKSPAAASLPVASAINLAAARTLIPAARTCLEQALVQVLQVARDDKGNSRLVINFGDLCDSAIQQALNGLDAAAGDSSALLTCTAGVQARASLLADLDRELHVLFQDQMEQLKLASFDDFKKGLSKLLVSPNLGSDMDKLADKAIADFARTAKRMVSKRCTSINAQPFKDEFRRTVKEHVKNRLLAARASGQYRPVPRKGVTVGFHWLLPKPFGNDYRQEPWMVHATDNMVYIPKDKITDVTPDEVATGDWRRKIVPSPIGNDMLYMQ